MVEAAAGSQGRSGSDPFEVVLWGVGHTHAHVLRRWARSPIPGARLTCVSDFPVFAYSGMLSGVLAGQYSKGQMEADLGRLCDVAGARLVVGEVIALRVADRRLEVRGFPPLAFDVLSVGIGSVPAHPGCRWGEDVLAIKPMQTFVDRLDYRLREVGPGLGGRPLRAAVIGGGAGGIEVAFCLPRRVQAVLGDVGLDVSLIDSHARVGTGLDGGTARRVRREFEARGGHLRTGRRVVRAGGGVVEVDGGERIEADLIVGVTGAAPPPILGSLGLPTDAKGFLRTRPTLQTTADAPVFAVGDAGTIENAPAPKAGVYAVRQGPVLWENLARLRDGRPPVAYKPQRRFLKLLNTGDGRAIAEYDGFSFRGRWCWLLKDFIDRRFMDRYQKGPPGAS